MFSGKVRDCKSFGDAIKRCFAEQDSIILAEDAIKDGSKQALAMELVVVLAVDT